ncbi:MAG: hypothetical protein QOH46_2293 [Solirubrobacteraceae bacterium]|nr:hypothetical protein [Solirubrobacteraceae bacterium]
MSISAPRMGTVARRGLVLAAASLAFVPAAASAQAPPPATLWATINACDPPQRPASVGVRVSMPNRRDAAQWVRIRVQFYDAPTKAWRVVKRGGDSRFRKLSAGGGRVLGGTTFMFTAPKKGSRLKVRGLVEFEWRRGGRVISAFRLHTTAGHADPADPLLAVSQAICDIAR